MGTTRKSGIMTAAVAMAIAAAGAARAGDELPRYRLEPGMELSYKSSSTFKHQNGMHIDEEETTAWVVRRNDDGSVRIVIRQGSRFTATSVVDTLKNLFKKQDKPPMEYHIGYFDLFSRRPHRPGRRAGLSDHSGHPLSAPARQCRASQGRMVPARRARWPWNFGIRRSRPMPDGWTFHAERAGPEKKIYGMTMDSTVHFDAKRGAIRRIEQEYTQDYGFKGKGSGLDGIDRRGNARRRLAQGVRPRRRHATSPHTRPTRRRPKRPRKTPQKAEHLLADAKAALEKAREAIDHPIFREQLDRQIAEHASMASYYADSAKRRAEVIGKPAADWELTGPRWQDAQAGGLSGQGRRARLLVSRLRLVHQGHAAGERPGRAVPGPPGRRPGHEHRPQGRRRQACGRRDGPEVRRPFAPRASPRNTACKGSRP